MLFAHINILVRRVRREQIFALMHFFRRCANEKVSTQKKEREVK